MYPAFAWGYNVHLKNDEYSISRTEVDLIGRSEALELNCTEKEVDISCQKTCSKGPELSFKQKFTFSVEKRNEVFRRGIVSLVCRWPWRRVRARNSGNAWCRLRQRKAFLEKKSPLVIQESFWVLHPDDTILGIPLSGILRRVLPPSISGVLELYLLIYIYFFSFLSFPCCCCLVLLTSIRTACLPITYVTVQEDNEPCRMGISGKGGVSGVSRVITNHSGGL